MTDMTLNSSMGAPIQPASRPNLDKGFNPLTMILFFGILAAGFLFVMLQHLCRRRGHRRQGHDLPALYPAAVALLIALGFEFVNGFHDTANAVATVIYTHSLPAEFAVVWSGFFNFLGVLLSCGRGRLRHRLAAAGRADPAGRQRRRLRDGVRAADRRDHLESRHLVARPAGLELAHADRLDHRRRHRQRADARPRRHLGRRLDQGDRDRLLAAALAAVRLLHGGAPAAGR